MPDECEIQSVAFDNRDTPVRGYAVRASYLKEPHSADALIEIFRAGEVLRSFLFPAYKIWNIAAHFEDIVAGEEEQSARGYEAAAWDGISGATFFTPTGEEPE